jgi:hypothetical protein
MPGEHEVHPYINPGSLCRGESCIRPFSTFDPFFAFSDSLLAATVTVGSWQKKKRGSEGERQRKSKGKDSPGS